MTTDTEAPTAVGVATVPERTKVTFVVDGSGSMDRLADDVRGGINGYIAQALADGQDWLVTILVFNTMTWKVCDKVPVADVPQLDVTNYKPAGGTALFDAVAEALILAEADTTPGKRLFFIETDGRENSSREHNAASVRPVIERLTADGAAFVFSGVGLTDWSDAHASGLGRSTTSNAPTAQGMQSRYGASYATTKSFAGGQTANTAVANEVQRGIDEAGGNA